MQVESIWRTHMKVEGYGNGCSVPITASVPSIHSHALLCIGKKLELEQNEIADLRILASGNLKDMLKTKVFESITLIVKAKGSIDPVHLVNAVEESQFFSCGLCAMVGQSISIRWVVDMNNRIIAEGIANFESDNILTKD